MSRAETEDSFVEAAGPGEAGRDFATDAWDARTALEVTDVELRLVGSAEVADSLDGTATARVRASWTATGDSVVAGTTVRDATLTLRVAGLSGGRIEIRAAHAGEDPVPLWLAGSIDVDRGEGAAVVRVDGGDEDLAVGALAEQAGRTVREVLPSTRGDLTVVSPPTVRGAADLLGRSEQEMERIAAVTTTVDGTRESARIIILNPALFETMDARAAQVVVSHEAVHQLTGIIGAEVETWVAEGFADWVALRGDDAPLALSAGQVLRQVEQDGPPERLPAQADFDSAEHGIGAVYEGAWMAFRMLDEQDVPDDDVVAFYEDVLAGGEVEAAAREHLGRSLARLTEQWQDYLMKSASTVS
ncbi:hypothetical protein ACHAAC_04650 [Aeromicrobium sp. CF4.19]|uniref:hypothetical protein n=1 Tax=Aeromicrobium sp. CF4.19 TaxID=3373082 RepID=UPI003EE782FD